MVGTVGTVGTDPLGLLGVTPNMRALRSLQSLQCFWTVPRRSLQKRICFSHLSSLEIVKLKIECKPPCANVLVLTIIWFPATQPLRNETHGTSYKNMFSEIYQLSHGKDFCPGSAMKNDHLEFGRTPHTHPYIKHFIWKQFCFLHTLETLCELVRGFPGFLDFADFRISRTLEFLDSVISGFLDFGILAFQDFTSSRFQDFKSLDF